MDEELFEILKEKAGKLAFDYEKQYGNCAQCTVAAVLDTLNIKNDSIYRAASGLASGGGLTCSGSCGGYVGGVMIISYIFGRRKEHIIEDDDKKLVTFQMSKNMHNLFKEKYGSIVCKDIHNCLFNRNYDLWNMEEKEQFNQDGAHTTKCTGVVAQASRWTVEIIYNELKKRNLSFKDINSLLE